MGTDDKTPTGRDLDKALELEEARMSERVRMRLDSHQDEDTGVIEVRAKEAVKAESTPPHAKGLVAVLNTLPAHHRLLGLFVLAAAVALALVTGGGKLAGWW